jgi:hypothetical protein
MFLRNVLLPSSGSNSNPNINLEDSGGKWTIWSGLKIYLLVLLFGHEDGVSRALRNISGLLTDYKPLHSRR